MNLDVFDQTNGFITQWTVSGNAAARTITLPLVHTRHEGTLSYNCTIDWGDGSALSTVTAYNDANRIHTYAANGTYNVEIRGTCEGWSFNNSGDCLKIVKVIYWGDAGGFDGFKYLKGGFYGCSNLTSLGTGVILPSGTGVLYDGFTSICHGCSSLAAIPTDLFRYHTSVTTQAFYYAFYGCSSLTSIPTDLFRYNVNATVQAFNGTFWNCTSLASIPVDLFRYNTLVSLFAFSFCFLNCTSLTSIPVDLFRYNTLITSQAFDTTFSSCTSLTSIPEHLFDYNTLALDWAFNDTFSNCTSLAAIPVDLFRYNTAASSQAFQNTFHGCTALAAIPTDLFRYNTAVSVDGFAGTFNGCTSLTSIPVDLFRYNVLCQKFASCFNACTLLASVPADLFRYNTLCTDFSYCFANCSLLASVPADLFQYNTLCISFSNCFYNCKKLQVLSNIFYEPGEETTRFLNQAIDFTWTFKRFSPFSGVQGVAPNLWTCDFGETISLSTAPATDWDPGDTITGQTSNATALVVSKVSSLVYKIKQHIGTFTFGETVGVTGVPAKLAAQDGTHPTFSGTPISTTCFGGTGNSLTSLSNYADIPAGWH